MRVFSKKEMTQLFEESGIGIKNSKDDPVVLGRVQEFGYTAENLAAAEALHTEAETLYLEKGPKSGKKINLSIQLKKKIENIHRHYMVYVKILRINLAEDPGLLKEFQLVDERDFSVSGKIMEPKEFYKNCLESNKLAEVVVNYGLTAEKLQAHLDSIAEVEQDKSFRALLVRDAEKTTEDRNKAVYKLYTWWRSYKTVLLYVFKDDPQQLEAFKLKGYSLGYKPAGSSSSGSEEPQGQDTEPVEEPAAPPAEEPQNQNQ